MTDIMVPQDPRHREYSITARVGQMDRAGLLGRRRARCDWPADGWWEVQGKRPICSAAAWVHWLADTGGSANQSRPPVDANELSRSMEAVCPVRVAASHAGVEMHGVSVGAGAAVLKRRGVIAGYLWGWTIEDVVNAVLYLGPLVVGSQWRRSFEHPDRNGRIHLRGEKWGDHAYLINGVDTRTGLLRLKNSRGRAWGSQGHAYISIEDMHELIVSDSSSEICLPYWRLATVPA